MARAKFGSADWQAGLEQLRLIPDGSPNLAEARFYEGSALLELDRGAQAERTLHECIVLERDSVPARQKLVELYLWEDRPLEARRLVWEVYNLVRPDNRVAALDQLFRIDFAGLPLELRIARLERFIANNPNDLDAVAALATAYSTTENPLLIGRSVPMLREVLEQYPNHPDCWAALAQLSFPENAEETMKLLDAWPEEHRDVQHLILLGTVQQEHKADYPKAAETFRQVLQSQPENWKVRYRYAACLRAMGETEKADRQLKIHTRISGALNADAIGKLLQESATQPATAGFRHRMGELYETVGRFKEARCWFEEALRIQPNHRPSQEALARQTGRPDIEPVDSLSKPVK